MRPFYLFLSLLCVLVLTGCGSEEEITSPVFSNIEVNGVAVSSTHFNVPNVTITGNIDDFAATIVANSTATGEKSVTVQSDGTWSFPLPLKEGVNVVTFTASDQRGNINQLVLTLRYDPTAPLITAVTQSVDPSLQLIVTFNEALLASSLDTALFAVDGTPLTAVPFDPSTPKIVTLTLGEALLPGIHTLTSNGVTDLAGNSVAPDYPFEIPVQ